MGLKGDFDEITRVWRATPLSGRLLLALSLFLASGSIASLSETVAKWKGFLLDGVIFYREWISNPITDAIKAISPINLPTGTGDAIVLLGLIVGANARVLFSREIDSEGGISSISAILGTLTLLTLLVITEQRINVPGLIGGTIVLALLNSYSYRRSSRTVRIIWYASLAAPIMLVFIAAAINAGLHGAA